MKKYLSSILLGVVGLLCVAYADGAQIEKERTVDDIERLFESITKSESKHVLNSLKEIYLVYGKSRNWTEILLRKLVFSIGYLHKDIYFGSGLDDNLAMKKFLDYFSDFIKSFATDMKTCSYDKSSKNLETVRETFQSLQTKNELRFAKENVDICLLSITCLCSNQAYPQDCTDIIAFSRDVLGAEFGKNIDIIRQFITEPKAIITEEKELLVALTAIGEKVYDSITAIEELVRKPQEDDLCQTEKE